jgi:hypothetical protein
VPAPLSSTEAPKANAAQRGAGTETRPYRVAGFDSVISILSHLLQSCVNLEQRVAFQTVHPDGAS